MSDHRESDPRAAAVFALLSLALFMGLGAYLFVAWFAR